MNIAAIAEKRHACKAYDRTKKIPETELQQLCTLLHKSPSSVNSQPWHYMLISSTDAKEQIMPGIADFNHARIRNASHIVVFCLKKDLGDQHIRHITECEDKDKRYADESVKAGNDQGRRYFFGLNSQTPEQLQHWAEKQIYLSLGTLLLGAAALEIDATPIEGFDRTALDQCLNLADKNLSSVVVAALGYHDPEADFNAQLPKSRLPQESVFTFL